MEEEGEVLVTGKWGSVVEMVLTKQFNVIAPLVLALSMSQNFSLTMARIPDFFSFHGKQGLHQ